MSFIFKIKDKTGREIHLSRERWTHIAENHPEMSNLEKIEEIKNTLIKPDLIVPHKFDELKRNYYKYYKDKKRYLLVAVKCQEPMVLEHAQDLKDSFI